MPRPAVLKKSLKKFPDLNPDADDFENFISCSLSTDTSVVKFHEDPMGSFYSKLLADRQTDKCCVKYNVLGGVNNNTPDSIYGADIVT